MAASEIVVPDHDYIFFGHSLGAMTAFALYQRLKKLGRRLPVRLVLSGAAVPGEKTQGTLHSLPTSEFVEEVAKYCINSPEAIQAFESLIRADIQMFEQYDCPTGIIDIPLVAVAGKHDQVVKPQDVEAWKTRSKAKFDFVTLPGGHDLVKQHAHELACIIMAGKRSVEATSTTESVEG